MVNGMFVKNAKMQFGGIMNSTWFTADLHFGHKNILGFEPHHRPFATVEEMNEAIIDRWNGVVKQNDTVYVLGDVVFGKKNLSLLARLKGLKHLVLGNHDMYDANEYLKYFKRLFGITYWKQCILTHAPVHSYNQKDHIERYGLSSPFMLNVHGHLHGGRIKIYDPWVAARHKLENKDDLGYMCVSLEQNNLTPFHADEILKRRDELNEISS